MEPEKAHTLGAEIAMRGAGIYNENSEFQLRALKTCFKLLPVTTAQSGSNITIADYGASEGFNSVVFLRELLAQFSTYSTATVIFNDTCFNDFNSLSLTVSSHLLAAIKPDTPHILPLMAPRSYYEQVLPDESLDVGFSMTSLHWLPCLQIIREAPISEENLSVMAAEDLMSFLQYRHTEIRHGGNLLLCFPIDGDLNLNTAIAALKDAIEVVGGQAAANAYRFPVYLRHQKDIKKVLLDLRADWELLHQFEEDIEHPASACAREMMLQKGPSGCDQAVLVHCAKALCDCILAAVANSVLQIIRFFAKRHQEVGHTSRAGETDQQILGRVTEAFFQQLLRINWVQPIGNRYVYMKLVRH